MSHTPIAILGTGFAGLGMAIKLKGEGRDDFVIFERASDVGGVWRDNVYPGCACDVESYLYSFSFAPNPGWSRTFSPQQEIWHYLRWCADHFALRPHIRFDHEVREAAWDNGRWRIETSRGVFTADVLIAGPGGLNDPLIPSLPGMSSFNGHSFHSASWDHSHDLNGRRVAVIGTGASAIQFVPQIQPQVEKLTLFQRTPPWIVPRRDRPVPGPIRRLFGAFPLAQRFARWLLYFYRDLMALAFMNPSAMWVCRKLALWHLRRQVRDPALREKLTPRYIVGCKRILLSDDYFPALTKPNVEVVTSGIREVRSSSIVTEDGLEHPADTIIFGTGFRVTELRFGDHVRGREGHTLNEAWEGSPKAHLGTTIAGFPNLFIIQGPNTGLGHTSVILMMEAQMDHVLGALRYMREHGASMIEPRPEAQEAFVTHVDRLLQNTVWNTGGCKSWYLDRTGRNSTLWPGFTWTFKHRVQRFDPKEYVALQPPSLDRAAHKNLGGAPSGAT